MGNTICNLIDMGNTPIFNKNSEYIEISEKQTTYFKNEKERLLKLVKNENMTPELFNQLQELSIKNDEYNLCLELYDNVLKEMQNGKNSYDITSSKFIHNCDLSIFCKMLGLNFPGFIFNIYKKGDILLNHTYIVWSIKKTDHLYPPYNRYTNTESIPIYENL